MSCDSPKNLSPEEKLESLARFLGCDPEELSEDDYLCPGCFVRTYRTYSGRDPYGDVNRDRYEVDNNGNITEI